MAQMAIFIDGAYVDFLCRDEFGGKRIDFQKFAVALRDEVAGRSGGPVDVLRSYYYNCLPYQSDPPTPDEVQHYGEARRFADAIDRLPRFQYRQGRLERRGYDAAGKPIFVQKRVDLMLGLDVAGLCAKGRITHAVLVGGDSDFVPAFEAGRGEGVSMWLVHGPTYSKKNNRPTYHRDLWNVADERFELAQSLIDGVLRGS